MPMPSPAELPAPHRGGPTTTASGRVLAGRPTEECIAELPASVRALFDGFRVEPVWRNNLGGLTFRLGDGHRARYLKWAPRDRGLDLVAERVRLEWAAPFHPVPRVVGWGSHDAGEWLITEALRGESAVSERWLADPDKAVRAIGAGLRALHDALPVERCPYRWDVPSRVDAAVGLAAATAREMLESMPPADRLVVCHGDACAPNTLLDEHGRWAGHVDLGALGVADRWADLAAATWSTQWNYGSGQHADRQQHDRWEECLLDAYGIGRDVERIAYYRRLWDLT